MTNGEAVNWIINISADIGKVEHRDLWHYEQALSEIMDMLETVQPDIIRCRDCKYCEEADHDLMCKNVNSWVFATHDDFGCVLAERREE